MPQQETLKFKIGLSGTFWNKRPEYSVLINDQVQATGSITGEPNEIQYVEFAADVTEGEEQRIGIRLENKDSSDTEQSGDGEIINDMLLNIDSIEIDEIEMGPLKWTLSEFILDEPVTYQGKTIERLTACVNLGMNGAYIMRFQSPFYLWLLENL